MEKAIDIQNISKQFSRNADAGTYIALRDVLSNVFKKKGSKVIPFWALKDINLTINKGERVGIIGRNGAGKSTLLKIISRITPPTKGRIELHGRVASLLEVGTGFHPELSGRENIYLNGSILGLKRKEINSKLNEIIDFSGVEDFIDTPLKNYSSGMQLRLAFSVAAHLEPEILLIDEVLAVGDLEFQKKCLGKMDEISRKSGRTILFVSHSMEAIEKFCSRTLWMDYGQVAEDGPTKNIITNYISNQSSLAQVNWLQSDAPGNENIRLTGIKVINQEMDVVPVFKTTEQVGISFTYEVLKNNLLFTHGINVYNDRGYNIFDSHDNYTEIRTERRSVGKYSATVWIPSNLLTDGTYTVGIALFSQQPFFIFLHQLHAISFTVIDELSQFSARGEFAGNYGGIVRPILEWKARKET